MEGKETFASLIFAARKKYACHAGYYVVKKYQKIPFTYFTIHIKFSDEDKGGLCNQGQKFMLGDSKLCDLDSI
jgi:hypothetical protein